MIATAFAVAIGGVSANHGATDSYGYRWTDSNSPSPSVPFNWVEIGATGLDSGVTGDDNYGGPFSIGFNFDFYGNTYTQFYVSTNGLISFGGGTSTYSNTGIPSSGSPNDFIAAYWDDDSVYYPAVIHYQTLGGSPNQQLVVEYTNVTRLGSSNLMTYEIILNQTGEVWIQYLELNSMLGSSATAGMENSAGTIGTEYSYNTNSLSNGLAIEFSIGLLVVTPITQEQSAMPGSDATFSISIQNRQAITDSFRVDPSSANGWTVGLYDGSMNPLTDTDTDGYPDTGPVASFGTFTVIIMISVPVSPSTGQDVTTVNVSSYAGPSLWDHVTLMTDVQPAWFDPPHASSVRDIDSDGLNDYLVVSASIYVFTAGWFTTEGYLYTASDAYITGSYLWNFTYLAAGSNTVRMLVPGWYISNYGVDGPYHMDMYLYSGGTLLDTGVQTTSAYTASSFMLQPGVLVTPFTGGAVDSDGNGLFDYLEVNVTFDVNHAGRFVVSASLYDQSYNFIGTLTNDSVRAVGSQLVALRWNAWDIFRNPGDGPYHIYVSMVTYVGGAGYSMGSSWFSTPAYLRDQFEAPPALFQPPHSDHANDTDGDTLYDYLAVDAQVNITVAGVYTVSANLLDWLSSAIESGSNTTYLSVGLHTVELIFPGWPIREHGDSGPWDVDMTLTDSSSLLMDSTTYTTSWYSYTDFRGTPAVFSAPYTDQGLDPDGDSLYDYLVVDVNVTVTVDGTYTIVGGLDDHSYSHIVDVTNTTFLTVGSHTVELLYPGWMIRDDASSGVFYVYLYLYDDGGRTCDSTTYTTSWYDYTSFQTPPAQFGLVSNSYALDDDSDGLYDWIVINATVDVAIAGDFQVTVSCTDSGAWWVANAANMTTLAAGSRVIHIKIPAWMIYANARNGTYTASMSLLDSTGNVLDWVSHTTASYQFTSFDPVPPMLVSSYASTPPVANGVFGSGEWAGATVVDLGADPLNQLPAHMLVMNNATMLFVAYDAYGDMTQSANDYASIGFDTGNDKQATDGREDEFAVSPSGTVHLTYSSSSLNWQWHCTPFNDALPNHTGLSGAAGFGTSVGHPTDHRIYEFAIPLALLGASPGDVLGFVGRDFWNYGIYGAQANVHSEWPTTFVGSTPLDKYGDLRLATAPSVSPPTTTATLSGTAGSGGWYKSAVTVTLAATGGSGGVSYTRYRVDGGAWQTYSAPVQVITGGTHSVEYNSVDHANQFESVKSVSVKIDLVAPVTTAEKSGATVWLNATDADSGVSSTMYRIDGGAWKAYSGSFVVTGNGSHTIDFYSVDAAGNTEAIGSITVKIAGHTSGLSGMLPYLLIGVIAVAAVLLVLFLVLRKKKPQEASSGTTYQAMPPAPPPQEMPPQTPPPPPQP